MKKNNKFKIGRLFKDVIDSIIGAQVDFTGIGLGRAILLLAIPMVLEMVLESVFAVVDIFFVSKLGADAVAAVGITESLMTLIYAVAVGLSAAAAAMVARRIGEKKPEEASRTSLQIMVVCIVGSLFLAVPGIVFAKDLLRLMGATAGAVESGYKYTAIMIGSNAVVLLLFVINAVFRGAGSAAVSMRVLWVANLFNIFLDPCLIFGYGPFPELGVTGAAVATCTGRGIGVAYQLYILFRGNARIKLSFKSLSFDFGIVRQLLSLSVGGIGQLVIANSSWIGMVRIIAQFGSDVLAGYTIAVRIILFALLPSMGLSNAAATLVGQNLGAQKPDRAERSAWITGFWNMALLGVCAIILFVFVEFFIGFFVAAGPVHANGVNALRFLCASFVAYPMGMVLSQAFNGAGDTVTPTKINFFCFWVLEIPLAWALANPAGFSENGVYTAIIITEAVVTLVSVLLFRKGKWKTQEV